MAAILAVHAHPDDIETLAAGTLALLAASGHSVTIATLTAGECGAVADAPDETARIRRGEAGTAAAIIGASYACAGLADLAVFNDDPSRRVVTELIRAAGAELVITASPADYHPDHEATSALVRDACFAASAPGYRTGSAPPLDAIPALYFMDSIGGRDRAGRRILPDFAVDVSATMDAKRRMLLAHESQRTWLLKQHGMADFTSGMEAQSRRRGQDFGAAFAEGFRQYRHHPYPREPLLQNLLEGAVMLETPLKKQTWRRMMPKPAGQDRALRARAEAVIPGGMFGHQSTRLLPEDYPQFFSRAKGARLWDADGNELLDFMCAYGPNLIGYGDENIDAAFVARMRQGDTMTGPAGVMVDLAEQLTGMVTHADWAIFCKNGADATQMALMTARAHTRRKTVVLAKGAYHGAAPWCSSRTAGVTPQDKANQVFCDYNDVGSLEAAVAAAGEDLAAIFAAPLKHDAFVDQALPNPEYARRSRELCDATDALLVVDDVRAGFRIARDCSWSELGVQPDLSSWGKCIANGHPISALLGSDKARKAAAAIFATGSFWYQAAPMAAALETLRRVRETDYLEHIETLGVQLRDGLAERAAAAGLELRQTGPATMPLFLFEDDPDLRKGFFWSSAMLERGIYVHPWHNMFLCAAMTDQDIDQALDAAEDSFKDLRAAQGALGPVEKMRLLVH